MSMLPSSVAFTDRSWISRFWATAATPAVRQLARPARTSSTGVAALSSAPEHQRVIGLEGEGRAMLVLLPEPVVAVN